MSEPTPEQPNEQPSEDVCQNCNDPACPSGSVAKMAEHIKGMPIRAITRDGESYINFADLGALIPALIDLQLMGCPLPGIKTLLELQMEMLAQNFYAVLHDHERLVDPDKIPDQVPEGWMNVLDEEKEHEKKEQD